MAVELATARLATNWTVLAKAYLQRSTFLTLVRINDCQSSHRVTPSELKQRTPQQDQQVTWPYR